MGILYQKSVSGDKTLAYFETGQIRRKKCAEAVLVHYDSGGSGDCAGTWGIVAVQLLLL